MVDQKQPQSQRYRDAAFPIFILMASRRLNSDVLLCGGGFRRNDMRGRRSDEFTR